MKFNEKCFRDIMFYIEENQTLIPGRHNAPFTLKQIQLQEINNHFAKTEDKDGYTREDIWYSITKIEEARYVKITPLGSSLNLMSTIDDITIPGHNYLARMHAEQVTPDSSAENA